MKHFKTPAGEIRAIDKDQESLIQNDWIEIQEADLHSELEKLKPELTYEEKVEAYRSAVGGHIDSQAQSLGYDNVATAVTYADEPAVPKFQQEGLALRAWRSQVWASCYSILADVEAGNRPEPTLEDLIAELPAFVAP